MRVTSREITVRWTFPGFHRWPEAQGDREYLSHRHRHLFHASVTIGVEHEDREIEFHDLLDVARGATNGSEEWGPFSVEMIAAEIAEAVETHWARPMTVEVFEDGECGCKIAFVPNDRVPS